jgi:hypothetical protein
VDKFLEPSKLKKALQITVMVLGNLFLAFVIIAYLIIHAMILIDISRNPSISLGVSAAVVCIVVALDLIGLLNSYIRVGIFPFKSNWFKTELSVKYPDIYDMNIKAAQEKYSSQWAIVRFITRPNPAKMANTIRRFKNETRKAWFVRWLNAKFSR